MLVKTSQSQGRAPQEKISFAERKRDESIEAEEDPKTNYVAVDEARYFVALHDLTDPVNVCYVTESTSLLHTPATKPDFALDTACSQHSFHDRSVLTSYQDLPYPQETKGYAGSLQAKGVGNVVLRCTSQG